MLEATNTRVRRPMLSDEVDDSGAASARIPLPSPSKRGGSDMSHLQPPSQLSQFEMPHRPAPPPQQRPSSAYRGGRPGTAAGGQ